MASREPPRRTQFRCAIYTRKSSEDGLDQALNSLDAQREACAAYILSQRHEGSSLVDTAYDDGGFSGGSMERPALRQLLVDIAARRVDTIVVYKIDRLTRSLRDFSRIIDVLDAADASFVSVTQAFNTTTSMGRLIRRFLLHVLPKGFHRIRHYGLLASATHKAQLEHARELLGVAPPVTDAAPVEPDDARPPCPSCGGHMFVVETFERQRQPRAPPALAPPSATHAS